MKTFIMKFQTILFALFAVLFIFFNSIHCAAAQLSAGGNLDSPMPTKEEIQNCYRNLTFTTKKMYEQAPSIRPPYQTGVLTEEYLTTGLDFVNYIRFIANLPAVELNEDYNTLAQYAAVVTATNGHLSHYPDHPSGMDDDFYTQGYTGASSSNLSMGYQNMTAAIQGCLDDDGTNNIRTVGHRRWLLNPYMKYIGFGFAKNVTVTKVISEENRPEYTWDPEAGHFISNSIDFNYIAWPCAGNFPSNLISPSVPWSLVLNPEKYQIPNRDALKITITRISDGKIWTFDKSTDEPRNTRDASLIISSENFAYSFCIIFHPGSRNIQSYSGVYHIDVTGLQYLDDTSAELHYEVDFFDINQCFTHEYRVTQTDPTCVKDGSAVKTCLYCKTVVTETLPATGHSYSEWILSTIPTCTESGRQHRYCSTCGMTEEEALDPLGHTYDDIAPVYDSFSRSHSRSCNRCVDVYTEACIFDIRTVLVEATPYHQGESLLTCSICNGKYLKTDFFRIAGINRFETAFEIANSIKKQLGIEKFESIIVADGRGFADALGGSYLAAIKNAPILLSFNEEYNQKALDYIRDNLIPGGTVYLLGGENAVPESFTSGLDGFTIKRLAGTDRFSTNLEILKEAGTDGKPILVCTGLQFADSLSASASEMPILLVWNKLTEEQQVYLSSLSSSSFYVVGGSSAVSYALEDQLTQYGPVQRLAGANRFETSILIAETFFQTPNSSVFAFAWNYPDGLCGGSLAASMDVPLILTMDRYEMNAASYAKSHQLPAGIILGSTDLISDDTVYNIFAFRSSVS